MRVEWRQFETGGIMHTRELGQGLQVSAIGLGAMGMSMRTAPTPATATT